MNKIFCDKCGKEVEDRDYFIFECFDGCLNPSDFDLCNKCWDELEKVINKFCEGKNE